ncbi:MAG: asparaginase [Thermoanaerobaculia bacterium]
MEKKSVYIAYTGGTIGMKPGRDGYRPAPGFLADQMAASSELHRPEMPRYVIHEYEPLLDSSNMAPADWMKIGRDLFANYHDFDGFIVLHGTDTMAYSAAALSFMFENLAKPVLFTGSQIPLAELRSDARENLVNSLLIAAGWEIPEVCLFVGHLLLRGNRATKISADRYLAFESPNYPHLGESEVDLKIHRQRLLPRPSGPIRFTDVGRPQVADIRLFPGITADMLRRFLAPPLQGAVLHTYGVGNAPDDPELLEALHQAAAASVVVVNCTQCLHGSVDMDSYATGRALQRVGVISGWDMTPEAVLTKLYVLLSQHSEPGEVRRLMGRDLRGELSRSTG